MGKDKKNKIIEDVVEECVSANECTGALQKIALDTKEVRRYHELFTKDE